MIVMYDESNEYVVQIQSNSDEPNDLTSWQLILIQNFYSQPPSSVQKGAPDSPQSTEYELQARW